MVKGELVTNTRIYDTKKSKLGIIVDDNDVYYAVKWVHIPKDCNPSIIESRYGFSLTQHFYKELYRDRPPSLFKVKDGLGND